MATLGSTAEPTTAQEWFGLNTINHFAIPLTLPAGGPWEITRLGCWLAGKDETCDFKLCVWAGSGALLQASGQITAASLAFALGNNFLYEADLAAPIEVAGGTTVYVGFARDPADNVQFGTRPGTRVQNYSASWPSTLTGATASGLIGAYIANYQSANAAPNAPVSLSPTGDAVVSSGTSPSVSGTRSDPDSGDYITAYQIIVYEDNGSTVIQDTGKVAVGGAPTTFNRALALNGANKYVKWKARTWDKEDVAGPYSAQQRFYANAVPATPGLPTVSSTSTLTPTFTGSFNDTGDTMAAVQLEVTLNASPYTSKWASGDLTDTGSVYSQLYAGSALSWGVAYRVRVRTKDSHGAYSAWSSWKSWTPVQPAGPDNLSPTSVDPRQSSLTPTLTVGHLAAQFRNDQIEVRTTPGGGTLMWSHPKDGSDYANTNSKAHVYAGTALSYGQTYYWRALIELTTGADTAWSDWYPFRINATPNAPVGMTPTGGIVVTDTTPELRMTFSDPDTDQGDFAEFVDVEVRDNSDDSLDWSQTGATPSSGTEHVVSTGALTNEKTYKWRARFTDDMGRQGAWSAYQLFKISSPPSATLTAPTEASTVTESTPTLDWSFSSPGGKAQYAYRIRLFDKGPTGANYADEVLVWDTGTVVSSATARDVDQGVLLDAHDYRWELTVTDTDLLTYVLA